MFKKLRIEFFFISRLFRDNLVLYFPQYIKNRFFVTYLLKRLSKFEYEVDDKIELHSLCQKSDLWMLACSLESFLYHSGLHPKIVIHDDGSIDDETTMLIESKFSGLKVLCKKKADELIKNFPGMTEKVISYRNNGHIMMMEFMDIFLLSKTENVIVYDSDMLFFKKPEEVINFFKDGSGLDALISPQNGAYDLKMDESYSKQYGLLAKRVGYMNPGLIIYKKEAITFDRFLEYFDHTTRNVEDYFVGMTAWGCLVSQVNFEILPLEKYILKGRPDVNTIMKHFTSPRRHELYAYGIDMIKSIKYDSQNSQK